MRTDPAGTLRFPWSPLLALATTGLVMITTETLPAGLLPQITADLGVSPGAAGQLVGAYAIGTVVAALPLVVLTARLNRRPLLLIGILGFVVMNGVTALSSSYPLTLAARAVAGACSGLLWGLTPGYARRLVPPGQAGRGLAVAGIGTPLALALGTPAGSFAGSVVGWRFVFGAMSLLGLGLVVWVLAAVPRVPGSTAQQRTSPAGVLRIPGIVPVLLVVFGWMLAHNALYTYLSVYLAVLRTRARVDVVLLVFGLSAIVGLVVTGVLLDRYLRRLTLVAVGGFLLAAVGLGLAQTAPSALYPAVVLWGVTFGGASAQLNTAAADAAQGETDLAATLISTIWNGAIFAGSAVGALLLTAGPGWLPWALVPVVAGCLGLVATAYRHAFRRGARPGAGPGPMPDRG